MSSRRNLLIRSITGVCGDIVVAVSVAAACVWIIEAASLGMFLGFLLWLIGSLLSLALSQYVLHPLVEMVFSDRKLDLLLNAVASKTGPVQRAGAKADDLLQRARQSWNGAVRQQAT